MLEFGAEREDRFFYIIFDRRRGSLKFWHLFTSKGYDHIYLLTELEKTTLVINPLAGGCDINEWPCTIDVALSIIPKDAKSILKYKINHKKLSCYTPCGIMSCISYSKYMLGVKGLFTFSPYHLYKQLLKQGAVEFDRDS